MNSELTIELPTKEPIITTLVGVCKSGKSYAVKSFIYNLTKSGMCKFGLCLTGSKFTGGYDYLPDEWVWGLDQLEGKKFDEKFGLYLKKLESIKKKTGNIPRNFIIFDDVVGGINMYNKKFSKFLSTFRHYNSYVFVATQSISVGATSTLLRSLSEWVIIFTRTSERKSLLKALYENWGTAAGEYEDFIELLKQITDQKYHALLFKAMEEPDQQYYKFKAPETPEFKIKSIAKKKK